MAILERAASALVIAAACLVVFLAVSPAQAQTPAPAAAAPDLAQRVADLEAYVTNGAPKALNSPGPGHNAWMMTSTALVLFMTLPGLALFYGGLVRRKNVLSVLDINVMDNSDINNVSNATFSNNIAIWLGTPVPEPGSAALVCLAIAPVVLSRRRRD